MTREEARQRIRQSRRCTTAQARALGYTIVRGSYTGTPDDRADRWYIDHDDDTAVDHTGPGYASRVDVLQRIADAVRSAPEQAEDL